MTVTPNPSSSNPFASLFADVTAQIHDSDPVGFHGDEGGRGCPRCKATPAPSDPGSGE